MTEELLTPVEREKWWLNGLPEPSAQAFDNLTEVAAKAMVAHRNLSWDKMSEAGRLVWMENAAVMLKALGITKIPE